MLIGGEERAASELWDVPNRHTGDVFARFPIATADDVEDALAAAFSSRVACNAFLPGDRARVLLDVAHAVTNRREEFARTVAMEAGKPIRDAIGEVDRCIQTLRLSASEAVRLGGRMMDLGHGSGQERTVGELQREPVGVVGMVTPFNFPLNLVAHKVGPAVAAGCPFVLKVADKTPISGAMLCRLLIEAGWVPGGVSVLCPRIEDVEPIVVDSRVRMVSFTGSDTVGWAIAERISGRKRVALELGGDAAIVVDETLDASDLEYAADRIVFGAFYSAGQSCISVQRIYVHSNSYDRFRSMLSERIDKLAHGSWDDPETFVGPVVNSEAAERVLRWIHQAVEAGASIIRGGQRSSGNVINPTLMEDVPASVALGCKEVFGPVALLHRFDTFSEVVSAVNCSEYGLQAGVFTRDIERAEFASSELEVGAVILNDVPSFRVDAMPYGGTKQSGIGREGPAFAIQEMTEMKLVVRRPLPDSLKGDG